MTVDVERLAEEQRNLDRQRRDSAEEIAAHLQTKEEAVYATKVWIVTAMQHAANEDYYRGLLDEIGECLGPGAFTADDGSVGPEVLRAKLPDLVRELYAAAGEAVECIQARTADGLFWGARSRSRSSSREPS